MDNLLAKYELEQFNKDLDAFHIVLSDYQMEQLLLYYEMLVEKNKVMNLTAITEFHEVMKKHFIDSLSLVKAYDVSGLESGISVIDIGTGAGFPGIPLKIALIPYMDGRKIMPSRLFSEKNLICVCQGLWRISLPFQNIVYLM